MRGQPEFVDSFAIAGIGCQIACDDASFLHLVASRYADFGSTGPPEVSLRVEMTSAPPGAMAAGPGPFARIGAGDGVITIEGAGFTGVFDEQSGEGWIVQPPDPSPLETFLTAIYANRLLGHGGFLLHAAAIVAPEGARVFFGPSGSGKTTVTELVGAHVVSDEIVAIRRMGDRYRVSGVPWRGQSTSADLAALFRLRQSRDVSFARLSPVATVRQLLPSVFFARTDATELERFLEVGDALARAVPAYEMHFRPDRSFWDAIPTERTEDGHGLEL